MQSRTTRAMIVGYILAAIAVIASAQDTVPVLQADDQGINVRIPSGQRFTMQTTDDGAGRYDVITQDVLNTRLQGAEMTTEALLSQARTDILDEVRQNLTQLQRDSTQAVMSAESTTSAVNQSLQQFMMDTTDTINTLLAAIRDLESFVGLTNVTCPAYANPTNGMAVGSGNKPGDVRVVSCDDGYSLVDHTGSSHTVVCKSTGEWSDLRSTACAVSTASPTPAPTAAPYVDTSLVTCCTALDNRLISAWADGKRIAIRGVAGHAQIALFQFPNTTKVLGIHGFDYECGCTCGRFVLSCSSENSQGPWQMFTPGDGTGHDAGAAHGFSKRWSVKTTRFGSIPSWAGSQNWSSVGFDTTSTGFEDIRVVTRDTSAIQTFMNTSRGIPSGYTCPTPHSGASSWTSLLGICGGDDTYSHANRARTDWFFRYDTTLAP